jgi:basic membrane protein A
MTGADTPANAEAAKERNKWAITYDYEGNCKLDSCLTTMYWNWGPIYAADIKAMKDGKWTGGFEYFDVKDGGLGLFGFMDGQKTQPGVPADIISQVQAVLKDAQAGKFDRFSVFTGPIKDNKGNTVIPAGEKWAQCDVDQFAPPAVPENKDCPAKYGNYWWNENITAELPKLQ